jgi:hypothetical protein
VYTPGAVVKLGKGKMKYGYEEGIGKLDQQVEVY